MEILNVERKDEQKLWDIALKEAENTDIFTLKFSDGEEILAFRKELDNLTKEREIKKFNEIWEIDTKEKAIKPFIKRWKNVH